MSLIISILAIILVSILAVASVYYGGEAFADETGASPMKKGRKIKRSRVYRRKGFLQYFCR